MLEEGVQHGLHVVYDTAVSDDQVIEQLPAGSFQARCRLESLARHAMDAVKRMMRVIGDWYLCIN